MAFSYSPRIISEDLVLYLDAANPYSYVSGSTVWNDLSRSQTSGSLINGPTFSSDNGGSIIFDGTNDYIRVPNSTTIKPTNAITLSSWVKYTTLGSYSKTFSLDYRTDGTWAPPYLAYELSLYSTTGRPYFSVTTSGTLKSLQFDTSININTWYNIVGTYNGSVLNSYLNGVKNTSSTAATGLIDYGNSLDLAIGQDSPYNSVGEYFRGTMGNVSIYNRALTQDEILQNYNALKGRFGLK
jgi:hypothetical protein